MDIILVPYAEGEDLESLVGILVAVALDKDILLLLLGAELQFRVRGICAVVVGRSID